MSKRWRVMGGNVLDVLNNLIHSTGNTTGSVSSINTKINMGKHMIVEVRTREFEFYYKGRPTGHFMRGKVKDGVIGSLTSVYIESLANGRTYYVKVEDLIVINN